MNNSAFQNTYIFLETVETWKVLDVASGQVEAGTVPRAADFAGRVRPLGQAGAVVGAAAAESVHTAALFANQKTGALLRAQLHLHGHAHLELVRLAYSLLDHEVVVVWQRHLDGPIGFAAVAAASGVPAHQGRQASAHVDSASVL